MLYESICSSKKTFYNKELVHFIDPTLTVIRREKIASTGVFEVKKDNQIGILKLAIDKDPFDFEHLKRDLFGLTISQGIFGIPKLFNVYDVKGYLGLLREYIPGEKAYTLNDYQKWKLEKLVREIHKEGLARLELAPGNVILHNGVPFIIDLGHAIRKYEVGEKTFKRLRAQDLKIIEHYCFPMPIKIKFAD